MISLLNDRYKISLILTGIFILGIGISLYTIYSLPNTLLLSHGYEPKFAKVYLMVGITFVVGAAALINAMRYKKEVIVFRDRSMEEASGQQEGDQSGKTTISLDTIIAALRQAETEEDSMRLALHSIGKQLDIGQGAIYQVVDEAGKRSVEFQSGYALSIGESTVLKYEFGEGLIGQAAANGNILYVDDIPEGYIKIVSGLGSASPKYVLIIPIKQKDQVVGIIELASFTRLTEDQRRFTEEAAQLIGEKISIKA